MTSLAYFLSASEVWDESASSQADARVARDAAWVARIVMDDERAFEALYRAYYTRLHGFARSLVHSAETAEEVVHDVFLSVWERRASLDVRDVRAYLFRAVRLRATDYVRTARVAERADREALTRDVLRAADAIAPVDEEADHATLAAEMTEAVTAAIQAMPEARAMAARLRWIDDLTIGEIAAVMHISVGAAQMHVSRAKDAVAAVLRRFVEV